jgi:uncharacterized protein YukE
MASDTSVPSLLRKKRYSLQSKALQDATIPSQRKAAIIYNVPRTTLQQRFHGRRSAKEFQQSQQRLSVQEEELNQALYHHHDILGLASQHLNISNLSLLASSTPREIMSHLDSTGIRISWPDIQT